MASLFRSIIGIPIAGVIVIGLFLFMYGLIKVDEIPQEEDREPVNIRIGRQIEDSQVRNQKRFERPALDQPPPPPPTINNQTFQPTVDGVQADVPEFEVDVVATSGFNPDRDAQPIVRIPPAEPDFQRCIRSDRPSVERVSLEFDVTPDGSTTNIQVVDSTDSCFERSAIRAARRWKYNPKIVDNQPQPRFGVRTSIEYNLGG